MFQAVFAVPSRPWDPDLPDDMEEMKLILHMWLALFYSKPSKLLSSSRKVVEHSNPEKYVSINSTGDCLELSDDGEDCFGLEMCPADSRSDTDQTPSSSQDCSTHRQGPLCPEESPADSQTNADGTLGVIDSTVSSSSGELSCEEEEPSSTSYPESLSLTEQAAESLAVTDQQPAVVPEKPVLGILTIAGVSFYALQVVRSGGSWANRNHGWLLMFCVPGCLGDAAGWLWWEWLWFMWGKDFPWPCCRDKLTSSDAVGVVKLPKSVSSCIGVLAPAFASLEG